MTGINICRFSVNKNKKKALKIKKIVKFVSVLNKISTTQLELATAVGLNFT